MLMLKHTIGDIDLRFHASIEAGLFALVLDDGLGDFAVVLEVFPEENLLAGHVHAVFRSVQFTAQLGERDIGTRVGAA